MQLFQLTNIKDLGEHCREINKSCHLPKENVTEIFVKIITGKLGWVWKKEI